MFSLVSSSCPDACPLATSLRSAAFRRHAIREYLAAQTADVSTMNVYAAELSTIEE